MTKLEQEQFEKQVYENQESLLKIMQENIELKKHKGMYKLEIEDLKNLEKVREITITDYKTDEEGYMSGEDIFCIIDDLIRETEHWEEEYNNLKNRMESYYELKKEWREDY